jgi:GTP-binding protein
MGDHAAHGGLDLSMPLTAGLEPPSEGADLETGRHLFAQPCRFMLGVAELDQLPEAALPEVALAGRSNVGKSSLLNALTGRRQLARISQTPGRTQQLNFFDLGGRLILVDLPGYGYAQAPKGLVRDWQRLLRRYLRGREALRLVSLLVDARHGLKESDREIMALLAEAAVAYRIVLTKTDLVRTQELGALVASLGTELSRKPGAHPEILATSVRAGTGIDELRAVLAAFAVEVAP